MRQNTFASALLYAGTVFIMTHSSVRADEAEPVRATTWKAGQGTWTDSTRWDHGLPGGTVRALLRGISEITLDSGRQVVGGLDVGTGKDENVKLHIRGGELIVRRNAIDIGELDRGSGEILLESGVLECVGDTCIAAANSEPERQCKGTLRIRGGTFVTRILTLGWGPASEATLAIEGSRAKAVHILDYVTLGTYLDRPHSTCSIDFTLDEHGVTPITIQSARSGLAIVRKPSPNVCRLLIHLSAVPPREDIPLIVAHVRAKGEFDGLPEGADISATFQGRTFHWTLTYRGGPDGCSVALTQARGHEPSDGLTHCRAIPSQPPILWTQVPLRDPLPTDLPPAFDGAEGFGAGAKGGRGGMEIAVENLNDSGPGSLRAAIEAKGPRIVVFRVAGTIELKSHLSVRQPFISILGQTAPSPGITLRGRGMSVMTHDVILRYLRIRAGEHSNEDDSIEFYDAQQCIADHCSFEWGDDETCSVVGLSDAITIQHCIIAEGLNHAGHSMASIAGGERITWHHNLVAHCRTRNPRFADVVCADYRNNIVYDWGDTAGYGEFEKANLVGNWYKPGPSTTQKPPRFYKGDSLLMPASFYVQDNVMDGQPAVTKDNWLGIDCERSVQANHPFAAAPVKTESAAEAYTHVLENAGATLPIRDAVDARIVTSVREGKGRIIKVVAEAGDE